MKFYFFAIQFYLVWFDPVWMLSPVMEMPNVVENQQINNDTENV